MRLLRLSAPIRASIGVPHLKGRVGTGVLIRQPGVTPLFSRATGWPGSPTEARARAHAQTQARKTGVLGGQLFRGFIVNQLRFAVCRSKATGLQI